MSSTLLTILVAVGLLVVFIVAMAFKVIFVKNGRFPDGHVCKHDFNAKKSNSRPTIDNQ